MTYSSNDLAQQLMGRTVTDQHGDKIGKVGQVYLNDSTGEPEWLTVSTGLFGTRESFVPLRGADYGGDDVLVPVAKDVVKDAPTVDNDGHLEPAEEEALYRYYADYLGTGNADTDDVSEIGRTTGYVDSTGGEGQTTGYADAAGHDISGPNTDDAMTRSEERLQVGTERVEAGRARLRKYVVT